MKKFLKKLIETKEKKAEELRKLIKEAQTADEVRALGDTLQTILDELKDAKEQLDTLDDEMAAGSEEPLGTRSEVPATAEIRGGNPIASFAQVQSVTLRQGDNILDSIEYRQAFAQYASTGVWNFEQRENEQINTGDIGKIIPNTVMKEFIKNLKVYGKLYNRVRKLNVPGGVEIPIEDLVPTVSWITETTASDTQKAPEVKTSVQFGYHIAEARIGQSLLSSVLALDIFEEEIAKLLAEAFVREFDRIIINGSGSGQPLGVLKDTRVKTENKIKMVEKDAEDWTKWRKMLFAKIPLAYRAGGLIIMTVDTWESLICTMKDSNNRPLYTEVFDIESNTNLYHFNGKEVMLIESDLGLYDYSIATTGQPYMIYLKPENYAINSNLQIGFKRYYDDDKNKWISKGLTIMDGKLLDVNSVFIISK